ncbi:hypothetical protein Syun_015938 [Stephania yunnanensis]|uniref:Prolamin-like domain-containing protein n=1 Tax=Stephania yunnanensis TaxID=152371 RepID=A0AAP0J6L6_9MAGN
MAALMMKTNAALIIVLCFVGLVTEAREAKMVKELHRPVVGHNLESRIYAEGGMMECWNALLELKSCSNEIVLFFLNGESYLGQDCCRGIRTIMFQCWPSMLTSIGFTAEEGDVLRGYCDASATASAPVPALSPQVHMLEVGVYGVQVLFNCGVAVVSASMIHANTYTSSERFSTALVVMLHALKEQENSDLMQADQS